MIPRRHLLALLAGTAALAPLLGRAQSGPQPELPKEKLVIVTHDGKQHVFNVEMALSEDQRVTGLMVNGYDIAHGGYLFMLADTAFACACNSHGAVTVAAGAEISFVASARLGDELVATAVMRTRYGRNGIYDVTVQRGDEIIAEFRGRSRAVAAAAS